MGTAEALGGLGEDRFGDAVGIGVYVAVPEAEDRPPFGPEKGGAVRVVGGVDVLASIYPNDQTRLAAGEVGLVGADGELAGEFGPVAGEETPERSLLGGRVISQLARLLRIAERDAAGLHGDTVS